MITRKSKNIVFILTLVFLLTSCNSSRQASVQHHVQQKNEAISERRKHAVTADSVFVYRLDSVFVERRAADTVRVERFRTLFRDRWHTDTLILVHTDTVTRVTAETVTLTHVEYRMRGWQRALMWAGGLVLLAWACCLAIWIAGRLR